MASIKSQMTLDDSMTRVLSKITRALDTTIEAFRQVAEASGEAFDEKLLKSAHVLISDASKDIENMSEYLKSAATEGEHLNSALRSNADTAGDLVKKLTGAAAGYMSLSSMKNLVTGGMDAANTEIQSRQQLSTSLGNMGAGGAYDSITAHAQSIQDGGMYSSAAMIAGAGEFATYLSDGEAIISMMDTLTDYAAGMSNGAALTAEQMTNYATQLGKVLNGTFDGIADRGFTVADAQKKILETGTDMEKAGVVAQIIEENWAGMYEAMSQTPQGQLAQLHNAFVGLQADVGVGLYPAILDFCGTLRENMPQIQQFANVFIVGMGKIINVLSIGVDKAVALANVIQNNWGVIAPIIGGIAAALLLYNGYLAVTNGLEAISNISKGIAAVQAYAAAAANKALAASERDSAMAKAAETAAQHGLNAAMLASPVTWIILGVVALVAILYAVVGAINKTRDTALSATGMIAGAFTALGAGIINTFVIPAWNDIARFVNFFANCFNDPIAAIKVAFYDLCMTVIGHIATMARAIEGLLNKIPGVSVDLTSWLDSVYSGIEEKSNAVKDASGWKEVMKSQDLLDYGDAYKKGYAWGSGVESKISSAFDFSAGAFDDFVTDTGYAMDGIGSDTADIADSTGGMAKSLDVSNEQLQYLRDIAERDAINRFTTAEVNVYQQNENHISKDTDLDGVISQLTDGFAEALVTAAEGVHA